MSDPVTIHTAKTYLSQRIARVEKGKEIFIARGGKPVAKLAPMQAEKPRRVAGSMRGLATAGPGFFDLLPEDELKLWNTEGDD